MARVTMASRKTVRIDGWYKWRDRRGTYGCPSCETGVRIHQGDTACPACGVLLEWVPDRTFAQYCTDQDALRAERSHGTTHHGTT